MADKKKNGNGLSLPIQMMIIFAILGAVVVPACFTVVNYWPQPVSVVPYFGWKTALWWGVIVGGLNGLVLGFLTDDSHFEQVRYDK